MKIEKNFKGIGLIVLAVLFSGWLVSVAPAAIESTAHLLADLRADLTTEQASSINYANDVSGVILIRESLILPASINYSNDVSGVLVVADSVVLASSLNYSRDVSAVVVAAYQLADSTLDAITLASSINYSNDVSGSITDQTLTKASEPNFTGLLIGYPPGAQGGAGDRRPYGFPGASYLVRDSVKGLKIYDDMVVYGVADFALGVTVGAGLSVTGDVYQNSSLMSNRWINYSNDVSGVLVSADSVVLASSINYSNDVSTTISGGQVLTTTSNVTFNKITSTKGVAGTYFNAVTTGVAVGAKGAFIFGFPDGNTSNAGYMQFVLNGTTVYIPYFVKP